MTFWDDFLHVEIVYLLQLQNEVPTQGDITALPKVEIHPILEKKPTSHFVNFTPQAKNFNREAFPEWRTTIGDEYLAINPFTKKGKNLQV